jgi:hypothetical protein
VRSTGGGVRAVRPAPGGRPDTGLPAMHFAFSGLSGINQRGFTPLSLLNAVGATQWSRWVASRDVDQFRPVSASIVVTTDGAVLAGACC